MRKKLQIVSTDGAIGLWVDGRCVETVTEDTSVLALNRAREVAYAVARALDANVDEATDPDRPLYRYYVTFHHERGQGFNRVTGTGGAWYETPDPVKGPEGTEVMRDWLLTHAPQFNYIAVLAFNLVDGPMD